MFSKRSPIILLQTIVSSILGYASLFFINRFIGPVYWGYLSYSIAFAGIFSIFLDFGINTTNLKFISSDKDDEEKVKEDMSTFAFIKIIMVILFSFAVISSLLIWVYILHRGFENPIEFWASIAIIPYYVFNSLLMVFNSYNQAYLKNNRIAIPQLIESVLRNGSLIMIGVFYIFHIIKPIGLLVVILFSLIYDISYLIYFLILYFIGRPWGLRRPKRASISRFIKFSAPLALSTTVGIINLNLDKILVQFFYGIIAVGALSTDQKIVGIIGSISASASLFVLPLLSSFGKKSRFAFNEDVIEYERVLSFISLPFVISFIFLSPYILNLFNSIYKPYFLSFSTLAVGNYLYVIGITYQSAIISKEGQGKLARISIISIIANIVLNILIIPERIGNIKLLGLGVTGACISFTLGMLLLYLLMREAYVKLNGHGTFPRIWKHFIMAIPMMIFLYFYSTMVVPYEFILLSLGIFSGFLIYFLFAFLSKEITKEQIINIFRSLKDIRL